MTTLVLQSHRAPLPAPWYEACRCSVQAWSERRGFEYRWLGDELFDRLPEAIRSKLGSQLVVASDLARLILLEEALAQGYSRVVWADADVLVIDPDRFALPESDALFGREVWVQQAGDGGGKLKVYRKIHNAFMAFSAGEPVLPFYRLSAERVVSRYDVDSGPMVPQLIGPKLITLLHNAIGFDVAEEAGVLSPLVASDLLGNASASNGVALERFLADSVVAPKAINLCGSSVREGALSDAEMVQLIERLQSVGFSAA